MEVITHESLTKALNHTNISHRSYLDPTLDWSTSKYLGSHIFLNSVPLTCDVVKMKRSERNMDTIGIDYIQIYKRCNCNKISFYTTDKINV